MDEQGFSIQVEGLTRQEFLEASDQLIYDMVPMGFALVTVITGCILLLMSRITLAAIISPYVVMLLLMAAGLVFVRVEWKKFPADTTFVYQITPVGWSLTVDGVTGGSPWNETSKLKLRRHVVLLYQRNSTASSTLPLRCLSEDEKELLVGWYRASRAAFKAQDRELSQKESAARAAKRAARGSGFFRRWKR